MQTTAVILSGPKNLGLGSLGLIDPTADDLVVEIAHSGISTGTEKLFWLGTMPPFPGMGYPLVPGYEACGEVVEAAPASGFKVGDYVFVPGANCFAADDRGPVRGLFGGASSRLVTSAKRAIRIDTGLGAEGALLALAATARHALAGFNTALPDLIVGHGVLGRLLARLTIALGGSAPVVHETNADRCEGAYDYPVLSPDADARRDYGTIIDASGDAGILDSLIGRLRKRGEITLAGFYDKQVNFTFPPAFMREAQIRIAAEWQPGDLESTIALISNGKLSLDGLITHRSRATDAATAYRTAFSDPTCLKMVLDWRGCA